MKTVIKILAIALLAFLFISCRRDKPVETQIEVTYANGQKEAFYYYDMSYNASCKCFVLDEGDLHRGSTVIRSGVRSFKILK